CVRIATGVGAGDGQHPRRPPRGRPGAPPPPQKTPPGGGAPPGAATPRGGGGAPPPASRQRIGASAIRM
ncbi:hypothetical protein PPI47_25115, partial [Burkholderia cenocepacia]|nr:hypothetical protein [Burkholderia cenocepacia]